MQKDLSFEISFYESLLARKPDFYQALVALGEAYTAAGMHREGLDADLRLLKLRPLDETVHYNLACDYSLLNDTGPCLKHLEKALVLGYREFRFMEQDTDLAFVRQDVRFWELLAKYRQPRARAARRKGVPVN
jgi:tetratricopeptide (TPR) repeat protein